MTRLDAHMTRSHDHYGICYAIARAPDTCTKGCHICSIKPTPTTNPCTNTHSPCCVMRFVCAPAVRMCATTTRLRGWTFPCWTGLWTAWRKGRSPRGIAKRKALAHSWRWTALVLRWGWCGGGGRGEKRVWCVCARVHACNWIHVLLVLSCRCGFASNNWNPTFHLLTI